MPAAFLKSVNVNDDSSDMVTLYDKHRVCNILFGCCNIIFLSLTHIQKGCFIGNWNKLIDDEAKIHNKP